MGFSRRDLYALGVCLVAGSLAACLPKPAGLRGPIALRRNQMSIRLVADTPEVAYVDQTMTPSATFSPPAPGPAITPLPLGGLPTLNATTPDLNPPATVVPPFAQPAVQALPFSNATESRQVTVNVESSVLPANIPCEAPPAITLSTLDCANRTFSFFTHLPWVGMAALHLRFLPLNLAPLLSETLPASRYELIGLNPSMLDYRKGVTFNQQRYFIGTDFNNTTRVLKVGANTPPGQTEAPVSPVGVVSYLGVAGDHLVYQSGPIAGLTTVPELFAINSNSQVLRLAPGLLIFDRWVYRDGVVYFSATAAGLGAGKLFRADFSGDVKQVSNFGLFDLVQNLTLGGDRLYFTCLSVGMGYKLCMFGPSGETAAISNTSGTTTVNDTPQHLTYFGGELYFSALYPSAPVQTPQYFRKLFKVDTTRNVTMIDLLGPGQNDDIQLIAPTPDALYAVAGPNKNLYRIDQGPTLIQNADGVLQDVSDLVAFEGELYFSARVQTPPSKKVVAKLSRGGAIVQMVNISGTGNALPLFVSMEPIELGQSATYPNLQIKFVDQGITYNYALRRKLSPQ